MTINLSSLTARRDLQIGDSAQLVAVPGIGNMTATCSTGTPQPKVSFAFQNESGGTTDQTLEYSSGTDAGTVPNGNSIASGQEGHAALRMKVATRASPATVVTFDLNMAANGPSPCGVFVQAIAGA